MTSSWRQPGTAVEKLQATQPPGTLGGRSRKAAQVPKKPRVSQDVGIEIYVQPDEPDSAGFGALWFDTDA